MIHIFGEYYAASDSSVISVGKLRQYINKKGEGFETIQNPRFYPTLSSAIRETRKIVIRESLHDVNGEIEDAISKIEEIDRAFSEMLKPLERLEQGDYS